jgi:hypothetical protein
MEDFDNRRLNGRVIAGLLFIGLGAILLMDKLNIIYFNWDWRYWPVIFIVVGIAKLSNAVNTHEFGEAIWWIFLGCWFFISTNHIWGLHWGNSWPILVIGVGVKMIWKSMTSKQYHYIQ